MSDFATLQGSLESMRRLHGQIARAAESQSRLTAHRGHAEDLDEAELLSQQAEFAKDRIADLERRIEAMKAPQ